MHHNEVEIGQHCWALSDGKLLVVMKASKEYYEVCGAWECGIFYGSLVILEVIERPVGYKERTLYYLSDCDDAQY